METEYDPQFYQTSRNYFLHPMSPAINRMEEVFQGFTTYLQELACMCEDEYVTTIRYSALLKGRSLQEVKDLPLGMFCAKCHKPTRYTLRTAYIDCEGCDLPYVPEPKPESYPIKHRLCPACTAKVPVRRRATRRTG